ncbi:predicted protein [Pyrenophora tritici-repentis Pt-1C-BFP]|uniref:Uncharacterized protein n=2 Tax=Pyrenophora tritici-repentis TaxID=45151 RepID=B2W5D1_PYRTR|nr:uncharacterized protein PTRG_04831 [Pyrenophora tritici-repentis Pt-1C-BFP]EDU47738.1 predicted protein [Pyrenophora tritici-repentis Pt-1C-BFP]
MDGIRRARCDAMRWIIHVFLYHLLVDRNINVHFSCPFYSNAVVAEIYPVFFFFFFFFFSACEDGSTTSVFTVASTALLRKRKGKGRGGGSGGYTRGRPRYRTAYDHDYERERERCRENSGGTSRIRRTLVLAVVDLGGGEGRPSDYKSNIGGNVGAEQDTRHVDMGADAETATADLHVNDAAVVGEGVLYTEAINADAQQQNDQKQVQEQQDDKQGMDVENEQQHSEQAADTTNANVDVDVGTEGEGVYGNAEVEVNAETPAPTPIPTTAAQS